MTFRIGCCLTFPPCANCWRQLDKGADAPKPGTDVLCAVGKFLYKFPQETLEQFFVPKPNLVMGILKKLQMRVRQQLSKLLDWPTRPDILSAIHEEPRYGK